MNRVRRKREQKEAPGEFNIRLIPHFESPELFEKRTQEVQEILTKVILLARKKGRPSQKEVHFDEAA